MKRRLMVLATILFLGIAVIAVSLAIWKREQVYKEFVSPDKRYVIKVFVRNEWGVMAGQSGDRAAIARLYDSQGRVINTQEVAMAQLVDNPQWTSNSVQVDLVLDWDLP